MINMRVMPALLPVILGVSPTITAGQQDCRTTLPTPWVAGYTDADAVRRPSPLRKGGRMHYHPIGRPLAA
jgi:hypothetical protein